MRYCGINARGITDIPFGVRAIQSGIEVEGIWISRPNTPGSSHAASSPTLIGDPTGRRAKLKEKSKGKARYMSVEVGETASSSSPPQTTPTSGSSTPQRADDGDVNDTRQPRIQQPMDYSNTSKGSLDAQRRSIARQMASRSSSANRNSMASSSMGEFVIPHSRNSYASSKPILQGSTEYYSDISRTGTNEFYDAPPNPPSANWDHGYSSSDAESAEMAGQRSQPPPSRLQKKSHFYKPVRN